MEGRVCTCVRMLVSLARFISEALAYDRCGRLQFADYWRGALDDAKKYIRLLRDRCPEIREELEEISEDVDIGADIALARAVDTHVQNAMARLARCSHSYDPKEEFKLELRRKIIKHVCFVCGEEFEASSAELCPTCDWLRCPKGHCYCNLSEEAKRAVDALEETYCKHCPFEG